MLDCSGMSKSFDKTLFENLDIHLHPGEILAIVGPSGCKIVKKLLPDVIKQKKIDFVVLIEGIGSVVQEPHKMPIDFRESAIQWMTRSKKQPPIYPNFESAVKARHKVGGILESSVRKLVKRGLRPVHGGYTWRSDPILKSKSRHYFTEEQAQAFIKEIRAPVLIIEAEHTKKDYWYKLLQKRITLVNNLQHLIIPGEHHLHLDNPEPVAMVITEFLKKFSKKFYC